jgi:hypothetical protein
MNTPKSPDVFYYNFSISNASPATSGNNQNTQIVADEIALNNIPLIQDPSEYYASIIRFSIPGYNIPVAFFLVQTPVLDINNTIYSFTLSYGSINSSQCFVQYAPSFEVPSFIDPPVGTPLQTFSQYYYIYDYTAIIRMWNTTLATATASLNTNAGSTFTAPFFFYEPTTQLISLYTKKGEWDGVGAPQIWFNFSMLNYFVGASLYSVSSLQPTILGKDNQYLIENFNDVNVVKLLTIDYIKTSFDYNSYGYYNFLNSILISTHMNVQSEQFFINNPQDYQNAQFVNVLADYIPDLAVPNGAGLVQQIFIYNASSLYRIFEFKQKTPLYAVSLTINLVDRYGNLFPLGLDKGIQASFKIMFIKKSVYESQNIKALKNY